jgi:hypothetical protein
MQLSGKHSIASSPTRASKRRKVVWEKLLGEIEETMELQSLQTTRASRRFRLYADLEESLAEIELRTAVVETRLSNIQVGDAERGRLQVVRNTWMICTCIV